MKDNIIATEKKTKKKNKFYRFNQKISLICLALNVSVASEKQIEM